MRYLLLFTVIASLAFTSCGYQQKRKFVLTPEESIKEANSQSNVIPADILADIIHMDDTTLNYRFIDLRPQQEFELEHINGAINIPFNSFTKNNNCHVFFENDHINILYGSSTEEVVFAGYILKQLNIKNFFITLGNYNFIKENIIDHYNVRSAYYNPEIPKYDYKEIMSKANKSGVKSGSSTKKVVAAPIKRRKKEAAGGGCD